MPNDLPVNDAARAKPTASPKDFDFSAAVLKKYEEERNRLKKPNVLVAGGTGAGKSTLVNSVFGRDVAPAGAGAPVTKGVKAYPGPLVDIYDSEGYESGEASQHRYKEVVLSRVIQNKDSLEKRIHVVWYCISQANHRVFSIDIETVNAIAAERIPVAIVLTQADVVSEEESAAIRNVLIGACAGIPILEFSTDAALGLGAGVVVDWTLEQLEPAFKAGFLTAAKGAIPRKLQAGKVLAREHSAIGAAIAAGNAAIPIPYSDAPMLLANQAAMVGRLASLWDHPDLNSAVGGTIAGALLSQLGKTLAGNLLKLTGVGAVPAAAINAGVASSLTLATGLAVNELCAQASLDALEGRTESLATYFSEGKLSEMIATLMKGGTDGKH